MRLKDIITSVKTGDTELKEYKVEVQAARRGKPPVASCYVPSVQGQVFRLRFKNKSSTQPYCVRVYIDGQHVSGSNVAPRETRGNRGVRISSMSIRPFTFSELVLVEDEHPSSNQVDLDALGLIELRVYRMKRREKEKKARAFKQLHVVDVGPVSERSKKAGSHCVSYGEAIEYPRQERIHSYKDIDPKDKPYMILQYRYRPKAVLQAQRIMPLDVPAPEAEQTQTLTDPDSCVPRKRTRLQTAGAAAAPACQEAGPSTERVKVETNVQESDDDVEVLMVQLDAATANVAALREKVRRKKHSMQTRRSSTKREPSPITIPTSREVIDLTLD